MQGESQADWGELKHELDAWGEEARLATFWWRDDDATDVTKELEVLLGVSADLDIPISIAVIPRPATDTLAQRLNGRQHIGVLQHGFDHVNHAPPDEKKSEYGAHRPVERMLAELAAGRSALHGVPGRADAALEPDRCHPFAAPARPWVFCCLHLRPPAYALAGAWPAPSQHACRPGQLERPSRIPGSPNRAGSTRRAFVGPPAEGRRPR